MLDLRLPIGLMFSTVGLLMAVFGLVTSSNAELYHRSLDINVNLWWGLFLTVFGAVMFVFGHRAQPQDNPKK
jgi:protein-S-isoprenylcysteine O-methyltransferase Ste14